MEKPLTSALVFHISPPFHEMHSKRVSFFTPCVYLATGMLTELSKDSCKACFAALKYGIKTALPGEML